MANKDVHSTDVHSTHTATPRKAYLNATHACIACTQDEITGQYYEVLYEPCRLVEIRTLIDWLDGSPKTTYYYRACVTGTKFATDEPLIEWGTGQEVSE